MINQRLECDWYVDDDECQVVPMSDFEASQHRVDLARNIVSKYQCSYEDAYRFIDLREEGYPAYQASVMAGISDPNY